MKEVKSILLVGVGGQGTILASKLLTYGLLEDGYDVKMSEIHGMSQRGGSVTTQIRYGEKVYAPTIGIGEADILVSFEEMETYRWLPYLKPEGTVILNNYRLPSAPILSGAADYPEGLKEEIQEKAHTIIIDASKKALELGNSKTMNIVLLGALVKAMSLTEMNWDSIMEKNIKPQFLEDNKKAFQIGMDLVH
ncbi:MAG: indolepyruvate oxidoreductase subunit beta [Lachnospiraceae bacterium]